MDASNRDGHLIWERPGNFVSDRLMGEDYGKLAYVVARKVKTLGMLGNSCPGRYQAPGLSWPWLLACFLHWMCTSWVVNGRN